MPKGVYKRKKKNTNQLIKAAKLYDEWKSSVPTKDKILEPIPSRLDVLMSELETEINRAITKLKGTI